MCGIVGIFSRSAVIDEASLERATRSLHHRGPDGQRRWISADRQVALGHARLSIIDLTTGDQPIANEDESLHIVVNGEFYGYEQIRNELQNAAHQLRTRSDSEIALHLYEEFGTQCLHKLRGEFAFVLWDAVNRRMFAARDRFGIKPLFYSFIGDTLYFASEVKALFAAGVPARWDHESIYNSGGIGGHQMRTLFDGVFQIPPGYFMLATEKHVQLNRYWDFNYPLENTSAPPRSDEEYEEQFSSSIDEAVKLRLRADVPVACYLSGGVDSCTIVGLAARHHRGTLRAFTLTFDQPEYNEDDVAKEMAELAGAEFLPVRVRSDELADHFADATAQSESLSVNTHGVAKYLLSRAVRDAGIKVVLTGEGSDEILGGYMHFSRDMVNSEIGCELNSASGFHSAIDGVNGTGHSAQSSNGRARSIGGVKRLLGFVPYWMDIAFNLSSGMHSLLTDEFLSECNGHEGFRSFFDDIDVPGQLTGRHPLHQSLYLWSKTRLPNYLLTILGDRMEMAHSVEGRVPFLDHRVVEVARSQPVTQKIRGATHKYVLRKSMRNIITDKVFRRPKQPFWSPPLTLNSQERFHSLLQDSLRGPIVASMPFFDQKKVVRMLDELPSVDQFCRVANEQILMMVLSASVLHDRFRMSA
jgi:asparagine synthase (glutamine-hydrolysing)